MSRAWSRLQQDGKPIPIALEVQRRLFDALVTHGGFNPKQLALLIDTHLKPHVGERHGVPLAAPDALDASQPDVIVVMSRAFASEISRIAKKRAPSAEIVLYADLLSDALLKSAA